MVAKSSLKFHFHNPNTPERTAEELLKIFLKADITKAESAIIATSSVHNKDDCEV